MKKNTYQLDGYFFAEKRIEKFYTFLVFSTDKWTQMGYSIERKYVLSGGHKYG